MSSTDIQTLLANFDRLSDTYMREEVETALTCQDAITPHLLAIIESVAANPLVYSLEGHNGHVYAAALLSHFQEPDAHLPLIRAFSIPEELLVELWGDLTTETLPTMLYRTCNGSTTAIKELVANRDVDQYVRCAAMEALSYIVAFDPSRRDEVISFFHGQFTGEEADRESYFWGNLAATLCDLHPGESMEVLRKAYTKDIIPTRFIEQRDVDEANDKDKDATLTALRSWVIKRMPADVHGYISWFAEFQDQDATRAFPVPDNQKKSPAGAKKTGTGKKKDKKKTGKKKQR
ncbi:DUF1186 domain-containing protein [Desulfobulbus alkaliphilus]|uniref:DUF1186 domain-containing protein n=1 Tax=Desulfobulbus alkaliphilus TaxID=869814 RepID=UPI001965220D|nr:DUF1186 domain-containing protein [Desulfobulbus alkaliphilus]MBM9537031.1 DUF1186 domain-containing protein [Desulfobulbus alkaliphilus]